MIAADILQNKITFQNYSLIEILGKISELFKGEIIVSSNTIFKTTKFVSISDMHHNSNSLLSKTVKVVESVVIDTVEVVITHWRLS